MTRTASPTRSASPTRVATASRKGIYSAAILATPGLAGYWRLGERSGTVARDELGLNHGTYVGSPTLGVAGLLANDGDTAVTFTAAKGVSFAVPIITGGDWTLAAWIRPSAVGGFQLIFAGGLAFGLNAGAQLYVAAVNPGSGDGPNTSATLSNSVSYMIGATFVKSTSLLTFYINGVESLHATWSGVTWSSAGQTAINGYAGVDGNGLPGTVDEPAIFGRALTPAEFLSLYRIGSGA